MGNPALNGVNVSSLVVCCQEILLCCCSVRTISFALIQMYFLFILFLQRYIAFEDSQDGEKKDLQRRVGGLESHTRQLELKTKNYAEQSESIHCTSVQGFTVTTLFLETLSQTHAVQTRGPCEQHQQFTGLVTVDTWSWMLCLLNELLWIIVRVLIGKAWDKRLR